MKTVLLIVALVLLGLVGYLFYYDATQPRVVQLNAVDSSSTITNNEAPTKTKEEVLSDLIQTGSEHATTLIKDARAEKRQRDSAHLANRQPIWVYQIGNFRSDEKDFEDVYKNLTEAGVTNLYIMKQKRNTYYLVKNDGLNRDELETQLKGEVGETLMKAGLNQISIRDLHSDYCGTEDAVPDGDVKLARKVRVECYSCK